MKATPLFDAWRAELGIALAEFGRKAELARHLSTLYGRDPRAWEVAIARYISGARMPGAEPLLAIEQWLTAQSFRENAPKAKPRRKKAESKKSDGRAET